MLAFLRLLLSSLLVFQLAGRLPCERPKQRQLTHLLPRLVVPQEETGKVEILGEGASAAPRVVEVLRELGVAL